MKDVTSEWSPAAKCPWCTGVVMVSHSGSAHNVPLCFGYLSFLRQGSVSEDGLLEVADDGRVIETASKECPAHPPSANGKELYICHACFFYCRIAESEPHYCCRCMSEK